MKMGEYAFVMKNIKIFMSFICIIFLSGSADFASIIESDNTLSVSQYQIVTTLTSGSDYYWRIRIHDGASWEQWSQAWTFVAYPTTTTTTGSYLSTTGDIDDTRADGLYDHIEVYIYSSDNDTLSCTITAYNVNTYTWDTLYTNGSRGSGPVVNGDFGFLYDQIRVKLNDIENNDAIYYTWNCSYAN